MSKDVAAHWNADTQGKGGFRRRDMVILCSVREDRVGLEWYQKRIGQVGEVSAVFDDAQMCSVLFEDGYWLDLHFDELNNTGKRGNGFPEIHVVPCEIWSHP